MPSPFFLLPSLALHTLFVRSGSEGRANNERTKSEQTPNQGAYRGGIVTTKKAAGEILLPFPEGRKKVLFLYINGLHFRYQNLEHKGPGNQVRGTANEKHNIIPDFNISKSFKMIQ